MSIKNRSLTKGNYSVLKENRFQNLLAKLHCLFFGHVTVRFDVDDNEIRNKRYCLCCWKELKK
jgi:hypothetical protein